MVSLLRWPQLGDEYLTQVVDHCHIVAILGTSYVLYHVPTCQPRNGDRLLWLCTFFANTGQVRLEKGKKKKKRLTSSHTRCGVNVMTSMDGFSRNPLGLKDRSLSCHTIFSICLKYGNNLKWGKMRIKE